MKRRDLIVAIASAALVACGGGGQPDQPTHTASKSDESNLRKMASAAALVLNKSKDGAISQNQLIPFLKSLQISDTEISSNADLVSALSNTMREDFWTAIEINDISYLLASTPNSQEVKAFAESISNGVSTSEDFDLLVISVALKIEGLLSRLRKWSLSDLMNLALVVATQIVDSIPVTSVKTA